MNAADATGCICGHRLFSGPAPHKPGCPALSQVLVGQTVEELLAVLRQRDERIRELEERVKGFERHVEREIEPKLLEHAEKAEAALTESRERAEALREAAEYYVTGWNNYDGKAWRRLRRALAVPEEPKK